MATLTLIPSNDIIATTVDMVNPCATITTTAVTPKSMRRSIRFDEDPVSDIFIVNRICESLILTMFYQPEDFARFRYERNIEMMELQQQQGGRRRFPQRCSMDLVRNNMAVPAAPPREVDPLRVKIQRPKSTRGISPVRSSTGRSASPVQNGRQLSPLRPCSRRRPQTHSRPKNSGGKRPMALAA
ncbi:expressed unknown protein [Seminavis robusta]|uniref:Uncharacterized protein n=1 Tax=Seminavis robusta TaxID=568900 RepID=A0A9N8DR82_9STRA|nr:expressed unknown protein [Seminavis robusta]|eukprot:Sro230_g093410.1 n/a (185) ;mRNA; f:65395-65949